MRIKSIDFETISSVSVVKVENLGKAKYSLLDDYRITAIVDRLHFIMSESIEETMTAMKNKEDLSIYRIGLLGKELKADLRYGHALPHNVSSFLLTIPPTEISVIQHTPKLNNYVWANNIDCDIYELLDKGKIKVLYDSTLNKEVNLPNFVKHLIDIYIGYGIERFDAESEEYPKYQNDLKRVNWVAVRDWYQNEFKNKLTPPTYVYRGVGGKLAMKNRTKVGNLKKYTHPYNFPISTSISIKVARDFARYGGYVLKIKVDPSDIILDTRKFNTDHNLQSEILLRPDKTYDATVIATIKKS